MDKGVWINIVPVHLTCTMMSQPETLPQVLYINFYPAHMHKG
jgi:hypothetical protein